MCPMLYLHNFHTYLPTVRAVHVRAGMVMYLIQNEDTVWVRNNVPILIYLNISEDKETTCYSLDVIR